MMTPVLSHVRGEIMTMTLTWIFSLATNRELAYYTGTTATALLQSFQSRTTLRQRWPLEIHLAVRGVTLIMMVISILLLPKAFCRVIAFTSIKATEILQKYATN